MDGGPGNQGSLCSSIIPSIKRRAVTALERSDHPDTKDVRAA
jgi:hypothetical protein